MFFLRVDDRERECTVIDFFPSRGAPQPTSCLGAKSGQDVDLDVQITEGVGIHMQGVVALIEADKIGVTCQHIDLDTLHIFTAWWNSTSATNHSCTASDRIDPSWTKHISGVRHPSPHRSCAS